MSAEGTKDSIQGIEDVARAYEAAGFDEQPPAHVDRAVLAAARKRRRPRLASFVPAFALAATVLLSCSLVLRSGLLGIGGVDAPIAQDPLPATVPPSEIQAEEAFLRDDEALDALAPAGGFADAPADEGSSSSILRRERTSGEPSPGATPPPAQQPDADADSGVATTIGIEAQAVQQPQAAQALEAELEEAASLRSVAAPAEAAQDCQATSGDDPAAWLQCISQRLETGAEEIARSELEAFVEANPDFQLPANLQALREP